MWRIKFLSTPSARRATFAVTAKRRKGNKFLSTPSARRATFWWADIPRICIEFLSTPSARRATEGGEYSRAGEWISIHALREEGDARARSGEVDRCYFYPRPPRGGRPTSTTTPRRTITDFYPRPPRGGRLTFTGFRLKSLLFLSTPSARRATRRRSPRRHRSGRNFYPRPPRGGRRA